MSESSLFFAEQTRTSLAASNLGKGPRVARENMGKGPHVLASVKRPPGVRGQDKNEAGGFVVVVIIIIIKLRSLSLRKPGSL